jgi:GTP-binding protein
MEIRTAKFVKGIMGTDETLDDGKPQIAFIGRSNVGKSSLINSLTGQKNLAKSSNFPGRTREINLFLINNTRYFVDLPGYGFAKGSQEDRERLEQLIEWYLFRMQCKRQKIVLIIDAEIGPTRSDMEILQSLLQENKDIIIIANKVDKVKNSQYRSRLAKIKNMTNHPTIIPYSSVKNIGVGALMQEIMK